MRFEQLPTPCYVVDEELLERNLNILKGVMDRTGCKILLAQKAFSMYAVYPLIGQYLNGTTCSGLYEARLGFEEMGKENHIFSPAYREDEMDEIIKYCDHIIFNSFSQLKKFGDKVRTSGKNIGLRINPQCSTQTGNPMYDPCTPGSRFGVTSSQIRPELLEGVSGIHFHTLCEQDADALAMTIDAVEEKFGPYLSQMEWINFGGGHHITKEGYNLSLLEKCIERIQNKYNVQVYLEPGEAIALNAGFLLTTVIDTLFNDLNIAILDVSAACHMPDVLEVPYRPPLENAGNPGEKRYTYRLGGPTCLSGDIIGDYSFDHQLKIGDRLVFKDMAIYTMVKNNTFNGMALPSIAIRSKNGDCQIIRQFDYLDFKRRLS